MIIFENIEKKIGPHIILADVNIVIENGEFVSIVGKSGAGKSTFLKILSGEASPTQGIISIDGISLDGMSAETLQLFRRNIGVVHQDFLLLEKKTVYENIAFAMEVCGYPSKDIQKRVHTILDIVDLQGKQNRYPHELSGGEKQRTAIARALIHKPKLLLADEPTGNLDPQNSADIFDLLLKINELNTTVIVTTHDEHIVNSIQKRVITIDNGFIVSDRQQGGYKKIRTTKDIKTKDEL